MPGADPNDHDRFFVRRRFRLSGNRYDVATLAADAKSPADRVCYVEQKGLSLTEDMRAYTDDSKTSEVFRIREHQLLHYDVTDASGVVIGQLAKPVRKSLLRSTWRLHDPEGNEIGWAQDRSLLGSLIRRMIRLIPIVGEFRLPIPFHFDSYQRQARIGGLERLLGLRDRYRLDLSADTDRTIDRRVALALAIAVDAL
jgi:hypothetical protein